LIAVFGNVGTLITFRVGAGDAEFLNKEFVPVFEPADLVNLDNYAIYLKMAINGVTSAPFSAKTVLSNYEPTGLTERIIEQSRIKYSKSREDVEAEIAESTLGGSTTTLGNPNEIIGKNPADDSSSGSDRVGEDKDEKPEITQEIKESLPEELSNAKKAEDYDLNNWYFLTRTNFRKLTGREEEVDETEKPTES